MNDISHKLAIQLIHRRMDGLLNENQSLILDDHLQSCESCRDYALHMERLSAHMQNEFHRRWDENSGPSQNVMEHVTTKARRIPMASRISRGATLFAGVLALIILAVGINFVVSRLQRTSPATNPTETVNTEDRLLAFASDQNGNLDIYTIHADGSRLTNITNYPGYDNNPFWSPDGKRIAFERIQNDFTQIYVMDADGSNLMQLTNDEADHYLPLNIDGISNPWSPDGSKLLFLQWKSGGEQTLYSIDIRGENRVRFASGNIQDNSLSWSPDGNFVGYVLNDSLTPDATFVPGIYAVDATGTNIITTGKILPRNESITNPLYYWSQDGSSISFVAHRHNDEGKDQWIAYQASLIDGQLIEKATSNGVIEDWWNGTSFIRELDGRSLQWLRADGTFNTLEPLEICQSTIDSQHGLTAKRSPNGNQIVNVICPNNEMQFYYVNSDATIIKPLLESPISSFAVDNSITSMLWSQDDRFIAVTLASPNKTSMYILNVNEPTPQPQEIVIGNGGLFAVPSWQPIPEENLAKEIPTPQPKFTPNSLLAFTSDRNGNYDIYTMQADGTELTNITNNSAADSSPFWSPDGQRIAFFSDRSGSTQIYLMDANGSNATQLTNGEGDYWFDINGYTPWSPDGRKLIFSHKAPEEQNGSKLYVIDIYEKTITTLTNEPGDYLLPSWSPNGNHIAFTVITSQTRDIFIVSSDGTQSIKVTENLPSGEFVMPDYHWSRDGENLTFITGGGTYSTVYSASLDGSLTVIQGAKGNEAILDWWNGTTLLNKPGDALAWLRADGSESTLKLCQSSPLLGTAHKWSNSGNLFLASSCSDNEWMFYRANPGGTEVDQLLDSPISLKDGLFNPIWSQDDRYIAFIGNRTLYILDVVKVREDPSIQPLIMANSFLPSWQPIANDEVVQKQPTPIPTQISSPKGLIAFTSDQNGNTDIYTMRADGSGSTNITNNPANDYSPLWSLDGQRIAFISERTGSPDIFIMNQDGSNLTQLTDNPGYDGFFFWSPDGTKIVYLSSSGSDSNISQMVVMNADGSNKTMLTEPGSYIFRGWSPDGQKIVYQKQFLKSGGPQTNEVHVVNINGTGHHQWTAIADAIQWVDDEHFLGYGWSGQSEPPSWILYLFSTNGDHPLQVASQGAPVVALFEHTYVVESGTALTWYSMDGSSTPSGSFKSYTQCDQLGDPFIQETGHAVSPDGAHALVTVHCHDGATWFYYENADGSAFKQLTNFAAENVNIGDRIWSPDGNYAIISLANQANNKADLYLFDIEKMLEDPSSQPFRLTTDEAIKYDVAWQPVP